MRGRTACLALVCLSLLFGAQRAQAQQLWGSDILFPHIGNGTLPDGSGTWSTEFVLLNNSSQTTSGAIEFLDNNGALLTLATNHGSGSDFQITIPAHGIYSLETTGEGPLVMGSAGGWFDHAVVGSAVFTFSTAQGKMTRVGVLSRLPMSTFLAPAEANTGIAITNPFNSSTAIEITLFDSNGSQVGSKKTLSLPPGGHVANNVNVWWPVAADFRGSVKVYSTDSYVNCLAIGFTSNSLFDPAYAVSAISYDQIPTSYEGSATLLFGANAGQSTTLTATGVEHFASNFFSGYLQSYNSALNMTFQGPFLGTEDDYGITYTFCLFLSGMDYPGWAVGQANPDGSIWGYIADDGVGNYGTFSLTPSAGAGMTIVKRSVKRTGKLSDYVFGPRIERLLPPRSE